MKKIILLAVTTIAAVAIISSLKKAKPSASINSQELDQYEKEAFHD